MTLRLILMLTDGLSAIAVFWVVSLARFGGRGAARYWEQIGIDLGLAALIFAIAWVGALWTARLYQLRIRWNLLTEARDTFRTAVVLVLITVATLYALGENGVSRLLLAMLFVAQPVVTLAGRAIVRWWFERLRTRGYNVRYMLMLGTGKLAQDFADKVENRRALGIKVLGHVSIPEEPDGATSRPILGTIGDLQTLFLSEVIDEIAVCLPQAAAQRADTIAAIAAGQGKIVRVPIELELEQPANTRQEEFEGYLVRSMVHDEQRELSLVVKRVIDIAAATVGLVLVGPLLIGTALAIRVRDGPQVLFHQTRVGLHGRLFTLYKFRTMVRGAEALLGGLWTENEIVGPAFQLADDSRVTPLGAFLRKWSLDELPQLWNVLQGSMSIVGPRPAPIVEVEKYDHWHRRRLSVKPGITGLAQVTIRTYDDFDQRAVLDMRYIDTWSLWLDLRILARTVAVVLGRTGR